MGSIFGGGPAPAAPIQTAVAPIVRVPEPAAAPKDDKKAKRPRPGGARDASVLTTSLDDSKLGG